MLLRQNPVQSKEAFGPALRPRLSPASSELETLSPPRLPPSPRASLGDMYPEESRGSGGVTAVDFLEGTYDYATPTPAPTPLYSHSTTGYYSAPLDAQGPPSDGSLHSLGSGPTSPLVFVPTASRFRMLKLKPEEFVCLKAIILLNSGAFSFCTGTMEPLHDSVAVQNMLDTITDALIHHISQSGFSVQQQARRQAPAAATALPHPGT
uniref:Estrogen receptor alpha variant 9 n=1 Tax=Fundulus heteroclitus TaxID=8078 RepID=A0A068FCP5_FUNHE|nr:estrogen receptor alpha variant 9 [Fundulus heteroclitus]